MSIKIKRLLLCMILFLQIMPTRILAIEQDDQNKSDTQQLPQEQVDDTSCMDTVCQLQRKINSLPDVIEVKNYEQSAIEELTFTIQALSKAYDALNDAKKQEIENNKLVELSSYIRSAQVMEVKEEHLLDTDAVANYDVTVVVGSSGFANIQSALNSIPKADAQEVLLLIEEDIYLNTFMTYSVPTDKGITSLTISVPKDQSYKIDGYDYSIFANGIPLIIDKGVQIEYSGTIYGGSENTSIFSDTSISVNVGATVNGVIYGGGKNGSVTGNVAINIYGIVSSVYGGGYAFASNKETTSSLSANVYGNIDIHVEKEHSSLLKQLFGGGEAYLNTNKITKTIQANVYGNINISVNSGDVRGAPIYGGGSAIQVVKDDLNMHADVEGDVSINLGAEMQYESSSNRSSVYGGGKAQSFFEAADVANSVISAQIKGNIRIDATKDNHADSGYDDWDNSMFSAFYGGGYAKGNYTNASVDGSTYIMTARKAILNNEGLFGGGYAAVGGKSIITNDTYVHVQRAIIQANSHENAKNVFGGGNGGYYADASVQGNTTVIIDPMISFEPGSSGVHGGGWQTDSTGTADVGGTSQVFIDSSSISDGVSAAGKGNTLTNNASLHIIGLCDFNIKSSGKIMNGFQIIIGDGIKKTNASTQFIYSTSGKNSVIDEVKIMENATLTQKANTNKMFFNTKNIDLANNSKIVINNTSTSNESISGNLSGTGMIELPSGKNFVVNQGLTGNILLRVNGELASGSIIAWSPLKQSGTFTLDSEDYMLTPVNTGSWIRWDTIKARSITTSIINQEGGSVILSDSLIADGQDALIKLLRNPGYKIDFVKVNGIDKTRELSKNELTLYNVQEDMHIEVQFSEMDHPDVEQSINELPQLHDPVITPDIIETVLDTKMDYESLPKNEKDQLREDVRNKLNEALASLPNVIVDVSGDAVVEDEHKLLENMTKEEAKKLKDGEYDLYELQLSVNKTDIVTPDEQTSIQAQLKGALKASQYDITVKKIIKTSIDTGRTEIVLDTLVEPIRITFDIPIELQHAPTNTHREFNMLHTHFANGKYVTSMLPDEDSVLETYTVSSQQFSKYTLVYKDQVDYLKYTINANSNKGGTISPQGAIEVNENDTKTFLIKADDGYYVKDVIVDGVSVGKLDSYTFQNVKNNHTIIVEFAKETQHHSTTINTGSRIDASFWTMMTLLASGIMLITTKRLKKYFK